jgi:hypothetical protein
LLFVAAAVTFMVITEKFVWLFHLRNSCGKEGTYQAGSDFPRYHDTIRQIIYTVPAYFLLIKITGPVPFHKSPMKDTHDYQQIKLL